MLNALTAVSEATAFKACLVELDRDSVIEIFEPVHLATQSDDSVQLDYFFIGRLNFRAFAGVVQHDFEHRKLFVRAINGWVISQVKLNIEIICAIEIAVCCVDLDFPLVLSLETCSIVLFKRTLFYHSQSLSHLIHVACRLELEILQQNRVEASVTNGVVVGIFMFVFWVDNLRCNSAG